MAIETIQTHQQFHYATKMQMDIKKRNQSFTLRIKFACNFLKFSHISYQKNVLLFKIENNYNAF